MSEIEVLPTDPVVRLVKHLRVAEAEWDEAYDRLDEAEGEVGLGKVPRWGLIRVETADGHHCDWGRYEIEKAVGSERRCLTPVQRDCYLAQLDALERHGRAEYARLGLGKLLGEGGGVSG